MKKTEQECMWVSASPCGGEVPFCHRITKSMAGNTGSSAPMGGESRISLQQRMQQALTADIASPAGPSPHAKQGPGLGPGGGSEGASMQEEDTGFWDLVYILYPDFAEGAGVGPLRELVPHWSLLERTLMVCAVHSTCLPLPLPPFACCPYIPVLSSDVIASVREALCPRMSTTAGLCDQVAGLGKQELFKSFGRVAQL